jgi:hypothetical protein
MTEFMVTLPMSTMLTSQHGFIPRLTNLISLTHHICVNLDQRKQVDFSKPFDGFHYTGWNKSIK